MIWVLRQSPNKDPKFHIKERFDGAGKSTKDVFRGDRSGWVLRRGRVMKRKRNYTSLLGLRRPQ